MDQDDAILAFDTLYTNGQIQMLKLTVPLLPPLYQSFLAIYIKFLELQYTLKTTKLMERHAAAADKQPESLRTNFTSLEQYCQSIMPYLSDADQSNVLKIKNMLQSMEQFRQMRPILEILAGQTGSDAGGSDYTDVLKNFLSEEQLLMFEMFSAASPTTPPQAEDTKKECNI